MTFVQFRERTRFALRTKLPDTEIGRYAQNHRMTLHKDESVRTLAPLACISLRSMW